MYYEATGCVTFIAQLLEVDREIASQARDRGCPSCGGCLHTANYPRKVRGVDWGEEFFRFRFSCCCGKCRKRVTPPSVRFLGRRVYAAFVVVLAAMRALSCEAVSSTLRRWRTWWVVGLTRTRLWLGLMGRLSPAVDERELPRTILERCEPEVGKQSAAAVVALLKVLGPLTTSSCTLEEGIGNASEVTQKMADDWKRRGPVWMGLALGKSPS